MSVAEPLTTLTDYALALASAGFAVAVGRSMRDETRVTAWLWCAAFTAAAVAGFAGGTFHGGAAGLAAEVQRSLWNVTVAAMGACGAFMAGGIHAARVARRDRTVEWLASGIAVTLAGAAVQRGWLPSMPGVNRNAAYHLIQIVALYLFFRCARSVRDRGAAAPPPSAAR